MPIAPIDEVIEALKRGEMIILVDDEDRENEGDLCMIAEQVTPEAINFMAMYGRGLICLALTQERLDELAIPMMVRENTSRLGTAFAVSIEAATGVTTGISAADRSRTIQVAVDPESTPEDVVSPGHIFPLAARKGGVLVRTGQTEGSVDLARLAGYQDAAVICEIMNDDGTMARMPDLEVFAEKHSLLIATIADLIEYRIAREGLIEKIAELPFPTELSDDFTLHVFRSLVDGSEHLALTLGDITTEEPVLVRAQTQGIFGDVFHSRAIPDGDNLHNALEQIVAEGRGVLLYIRRPISLAEEVDRLRGKKPARKRSEESINRPAPELRNFGIGAQCLRSLGLSKLRLLTNNPRRIVGIESYDLEIVEQVPIPKTRHTAKMNGAHAAAAAAPTTDSPAAKEA